MEHIKQGHMTANLEGLFKLLSEKLYSNRDIFVRELIQNAYDAISRRKIIDANFDGAIDIISDLNERTLTFIDNGIGMSENDIDNFLSVVGNSGTKSESQLNEKLSALTVGQFGIGFLSAFAVAKKITVDTLKLNERRSFLWSSEGSLDYNLYRSSKDDIGTKITVFLSNDFSYYLDVDRLKKIIVTYSNLIPIPIRINYSEAVNSMFAPWEQNVFDDEEGVYSDFITASFGEFPLIVFPLQINAHDISAKGVLYIPDRIPETGSGKADVYIRKMLVKENDSLILPEWASFIHGMIDCPDLSPNSARDGFSMSDKVFAKLKAEMETFIFDRLVAIFKRHFDLFVNIYVNYGDSLRMSAMKDIKFFDKFSNYILYLSNNEDNVYTIPRYINVSPTVNGKTAIFYCTDRSLFSKLKELDSSDKLILDATNPLDEALLKLYAKHHSGIELKSVNETFEEEVFSELSSTEERLYEQLLHDIQRFINRRVSNRITVEIKCLSNKSIISTLINTNRNIAEELWRNLQLNPTISHHINEVWDEVVRLESISPKKLILNAKNQFVEQLAKTTYESTSAIEVIYKAFLYNAYLQIVDSDDNRHNLKTLIDDFLSEIFKLLETNRTLNVIDVAPHISAVPIAHKSDIDHIKMFLIFPEGYAKIETAVRTVFENPPFFFEVATAADFIHKSILTDNVKEHIRTADTFIAEISDLNENVMMEVGAILISGDSRSLFALRNKNAKLLPADIKSNLYIPYSSMDNSAVVIANEIKDTIFRNGKIVYADILELISKRKKRYISHTLLNTLPIKLSQESIEKIMQQYQYVEDIIIDQDNFASRIGLDDQYSNIVVGTLKGYVEKHNSNFKPDSI